MLSPDRRRRRRKEEEEEEEEGDSATMRKGFLLPIAEWRSGSVLGP